MRLKNFIPVLFVVILGAGSIIMGFYNYRLYNELSRQKVELHELNEKLHAPGRLIKEADEYMRKNWFPQAKKSLEPVINYHKDSEEYGKAQTMMRDLNIMIDQGKIKKVLTVYDDPRKVRD